MKKIILFITTAVCLFCGIKNTNAASINISCPDETYPNETITCQVSLSSSVSITGINANFNISEATFQSFDLSNSWSSYFDSSSGFAIGNLSGTQSGIIGSIKVTAGSNINAIVVVGLNNVEASDIDDELVNISNTSKNIKIISRPTTTTTTTKTTTTQPTTKVTTTKAPTTTKAEPTTKAPTTTQTTTKATVPTSTTKAVNAYLNSLTIEGYDIDFKRYVYEYNLEVDYFTDKLNISAETDGDNTISGTGNVLLNEGNNTIKVVVTNKENESRSYIINVYRKEQTNNVVNNNVEEVTQAFETNKDIVINLNQDDENLIAYSNILDTIKGQNRTVTYNVIDNSNIVYSYVFNGKEFNQTYNDIDLKILFNTEKEEIINNILKDDKKIILNMNYTGNFPDGTILKVKNMTNYHQESSLKLYKLNIEDNLELIKNNIKINNNYMEFTIEKGSLYVISNKNTKSKNISILFIIVSAIVILEILIVGYLIMRKKKQIEMPKLDAYLENPDFIDDEENIQNMVNNQQDFTNQSENNN